jgi:cholesterol oxidase
VDFDWLVIGSGFGGSVSALRLAQKGYSVGVIECGRRFADDELPKSTWDVRRYWYAPRLGLNGIFRLTIFKDVAIASGSGVGGGSLGYANTLYRAPTRFYEDAQWAGLNDWQVALAPHYEEAERMLGVATYDEDDPADDYLREYAEEIGVSATHAKTRVGVYLGAAGETVADPFFGGEGPDRTGCLRCGRCMVGCPHGAKNTLVKNYLWFAERDGVTVMAAGALGTNRLLAACKLNGSLPELSPRLGELVRTNSEAILAVTLPEASPEVIHRVAITGSIYPDPNTHIETVVYGDAGDGVSGLFTLLTGAGTPITRPLRLAGAAVRHPRTLAKTLNPRGWSERTIIILVMQSLDNAISLRARRGRGGRVRLRTEQDPERPNPTFIPVANEFAAWLAERTGGIAQSSIMEAVANIPSTAHILGGAVIGADRSRGVVDARQQVFGYENLLICDGAAIPANVGVNPSLTITALAEHAMSHVPSA